MFKSGYVYFIGRPNVGKSSIINRLMGEKLALVSEKPQATRNNIQFIDTSEDAQLIYVDTPGIQVPKNKLGEFLFKLSEKAFKDADLICYTVEPFKELGKLDNMIIDLIKEKKKHPKILLVINQIDRVGTYDEVISFFRDMNLFDDFCGVSAESGSGISELREKIKNLLPEGPKYYPDDMIVDKSERFIVSEIIREKAMELLSEELPHGIAIEISEFKEGKPVRIEATIYCERKSHKGMIIGKDGSMIKQIGINSRKEIEDFLGEKVFLKLLVKVALDWRNKPLRLSSFGYMDD